MPRHWGWLVIKGLYRGKSAQSQSNRTQLGGDTDATTELRSDLEVSEFGRTLTDEVSMPVFFISLASI